MATKKEAKPNVYDPSIVELIAVVDKKINENDHALFKAHWVNVRDSLVQLEESQKRYDLLYGTGRTTEGKDANKNLARDDKNRVE